MKLIILITVVLCASTKAQYFPFTNINVQHPFGYSTTTYSAQPFTTLATPRFYYSTNSLPTGTSVYSYTIPSAPAPAPVVAYTQNQHHSQNEAGETSFGYSYPGQSHSVTRDAAGNERGTYSYIDPEGKEVRATYTAGADGFKIDSNVLPQPPPQIGDTPEVIAARSEHLRALEDANARSLSADQPAQSRKKRGAALYTAPVAALPVAAFPYASSYSYRVDKPVVRAVVAPTQIVKTYAAAPVAYRSFYNAPALSYAHTPYAYRYTAGYTPIPYASYLG